MIFIIHGSDTVKSRKRLYQLLEEYKDKEKLSLEAKSTTEEELTLFLGSISFLQESKLLVLENLFSVPKPKLDKFVPLIQSLEGANTIIIYQDKDLTQAQLKVFANAKIEQYKVSKNVFALGFMMKPQGAKTFLSEYEKLLQAEPFELIFYVIRDSLRKQLGSWSKLPADKVKNAYIQCIELDFQIKTGTLAIPKETALERILLNLLS